MNRALNVLLKNRIIIIIKKTAKMHTPLDLSLIYAGKKKKPKFPTIWGAQFGDTEHFAK